MILKGLPEEYKPFVVHVTQSTSEITFLMFTSQLKSFEQTEKFNCTPKIDQVLKTDSPIKFPHMHVMVLVAKAISRGIVLTKLRVKQPSGAHTTSQQHIMTVPVEDVSKNTKKLQK